MPMSAGGFVETAEIRTALKGREADVLDALKIPWRQGKPHITCPYPDHPDDNPSWRWDTHKARAYCSCHRGGRSVLDVIMHMEKVDIGRAMVRAAELSGRADLIRQYHNRKREGGGGDIPPKQHCNSATPAGCRFADYAAAKKLPTDFLRSLGLTEIMYQGVPAVRIPYFAADGTEAAVRFRITLAGRERFRWRKRSKPCLYGIDRLAQATKAGYVLLVEGESDCHVLWLHGIPALGLPGNTNWNEQRDAALLANIPVIYVVIEPGQSGDGVLQWLSRSTIAPRARLVRLPLKDPSALYLVDPESFRSAFQRALDKAAPYQAMADREAEAEAARARQAAGDLIFEPDILARFAADLELAGLVGETKNGKVLFLALTTRLFERPVSIAVKGPSSGGKSFTVEVVLRFFPPAAYFERTAMSDRALAYSDEDFRHRHLVIYEAAGMASDIASYLIRSLLSERRIRYELVEKTKDGMKPRLIEKSGPTGLIVTTTATKLHAENETRLVSLTVKDTPQQTAAILRALARGEEIGGAVDYAKWQAHQKWLAAGERRVTVPFAAKLAELIPPVAVRLRRDFRLLLALIHAHALLHRNRRDRDDQGRIIATIADYATVRELVADLFAEGAEVTVSKAVRSTVEAVQALPNDEVSVAEIAKSLKIDESSTSRRVKAAVSRGYLVNREIVRGKRARIALDGPMPDDGEILPQPDKLVDPCSTAVFSEGYDTPSLPSGNEMSDIPAGEEAII